MRAAPAPHGGKVVRDPSAGIWDREHRALTLGLLLTVSSTAFEALAVATILPATDGTQTLGIALIDIAAIVVAAAGAITASRLPTRTTLTGAPNDLT